MPKKVAFHQKQSDRQQAEDNATRAWQSRQDAKIKTKGIPASDFAAPLKKFSRDAVGGYRKG